MMLKKIIITVFNLTSALSFKTKQPEIGLVEMVYSVVH